MRTEARVPKGLTFGWLESCSVRTQCLGIEHGFRVSLYRIRDFRRHRIQIGEDSVQLGRSVNITDAKVAVCLAQAMG